MPLRRHHRRLHATRRALRAAPWCGLLLALGCREPPAQVVDNARMALESRDEEAFLALCEPSAAALLRRAEDVSKSSGRVFKVLADGKPTTALLPKGDIGEAVESGHRAVVEVRKGDQVSRVPLRLVRGQWRLDLMEMDAFLAAMRPRGN